MKPSIGRIVHFVDSSGIHQPAVITKLCIATCVNLQVLPDSAAPYVFTYCPADETAARLGSWHWPEKV